MTKLTRRSLLRASVGLAAAGTLARPYVANAQAKTATVWWVQGFIPQEDAAFKKLCADYEKASGNKLDYSIVPFAPLRQKFITAITSGEVPDLVNPAFGPYVPEEAWNDRLVDLTDVIDADKSRYSATALLNASCYNNATKKRSFYAIPYSAAMTPFHIWGSLVEKAGYKTSDFPKTWDAFIDFFKPMQQKLQAQGMNHTYSYGFVVGTVGIDPVNTLNHFIVAYGGKDLVTPDGKLNSRDPHVREAVVRAVSKLSTLYKEGYIPPSTINWNDADDNNAFHSKLCVMDFDGTLSTELAMLQTQKDELKNVITLGLPLNNEGKQIPGFMGTTYAVVPKGAKNVAVAKDFAKYFMQPEVNNEWLKGGLGRFLPVYPELAKNDPFWLQSKTSYLPPYAKEGLVDPTIPPWYAYNPAEAQMESEHVFNRAMIDVTKGMSTKQAVDKAFARAELIFTKYPIQQA
ncbi:MAG TPA: ABC transporter substrate-binding protein [Stellaceae bacterium]|nr:ABC transporter substrate-binding protein [Stellaceae bacterium]